MIERLSSLAWRLRIYLLSGAILVFAAVTLTSFLVTRRMLKEQNEGETSYMAKSAARQLDTLFAQIKSATDGMARHLEASPPQSHHEIQQMLELMLRSHSAINGTCVAFDRDFHTSFTEEARAPFFYRENGAFAYMDLAEYELWDTEDWYFVPAELQQPVWTEPYIDPDSNYIMMVTYSVPFYQVVNGERKFGGIVLADITMDWVQDVIEGLPLDKDDYAFLISGQGTFIAHPRHELVMNHTIFSLAEEVKDPQIRKTGRAMLVGDENVTQYTSYHLKQNSWLAYSPIPSTNWTLGIFVSQKRMQEMLAFHTGLMAQLGVLGVLGLLLVIQVIARSITSPLKELQHKARVLATGDLNTPLDLQTKYQDEVASLGASFEKMRIDLKRYMMELKQTVSRKERIESELRIARDIQMSLVPKTFPAFPARNDMDLFATMVPAYDVGGDFYDFFLIDENRLLLCIADVSGKGVPAALFMAVTRSFLRSMFRSETSIADAIFHINNELSFNNDSCMFVTLLCAVVDLKTGMLTYVNAGHNLPCLINQDKDRLVQLKEQHGPPLGMMDNAEYSESTVQLTANDMLYFYTDGVNEAMNQTEEMFGDERMITALKETTLLSCQQASQLMLNRVQEFTRGAEQNDDITMMFWRWLPLTDES